MERNFCFVTLALGQAYCDMAKQLASDLAQHAPGRLLVVATDRTEDFAECANVRAHSHVREGLFHCFNDKRFGVEFALAEHCETAIFVDADTRIKAPLPPTVSLASPLTTAYTPNLLEQAEKWLSPRERRAVLDAARSLGVEPAAAKFVWDNIFALTRDQGREKVFIKMWGVVTRLFDFQGVDITDGYCMAIAAAVVGWSPDDRGLGPIVDARDHFEIGHTRDANSLSLAGRALFRAGMWFRWRAHRRREIRLISGGRGPESSGQDNK